MRNWPNTRSMKGSSDREPSATWALSSGPSISISPLRCGTSM
jgi:hypothetical protein